MHQSVQTALNANTILNTVDLLLFVDPPSLALPRSQSFSITDSSLRRSSPLERWKPKTKSLLKGPDSQFTLYHSNEAITIFNFTLFFGRIMSPANINLLILV